MAQRLSGSLIAILLRSIDGIRQWPSTMAFDNCVRQYGVVNGGAESSGYTGRRYRCNHRKQELLGEN